MKNNFKLLTVLLVTLSDISTAGSLNTPVIIKYIKIIYKVYMDDFKYDNQISISYHRHDSDFFSLAPSNSYGKVRNYGLTNGWFRSNILANKNFLNSCRLKNDHTLTCNYQGDDLNFGVPENCRVVIKEDLSESNKMLYGGIIFRLDCFDKKMNIKWYELR